jgi:hypothetical protein
MVSTTSIIIVQFLEGLGCHFRFVGFGMMIIVILGFGFWKEDVGFGYAYWMVVVLFWGCEFWR